MLSAAKHLKAHPASPFAALRVTREPCHQGNPVMLSTKSCHAERSEASQGPASPFAALRVTRRGHTKGVALGLASPAAFRVPEKQTAQVFYVGTSLSLKKPRTPQQKDQ